MSTAPPKYHELEGVTIKGVDVFKGDHYHIKGPEMKTGTYRIRSVLDFVGSQIMIGYIEVGPDGRDKVNGGNHPFSFFTKLTIKPVPRPRAKK
jgi:hypothetical protein